MEHGSIRSLIRLPDPPDANQFVRRASRRAAGDRPQHQRLRGRHWPLRDGHRQLSAPARLACRVFDYTRAALVEPAPSDQAQAGAIRRLVAVLRPDARRARPLVGGEAGPSRPRCPRTQAGGRHTADRCVPQRRPQDDDALSVPNGRTILLHTLVESAAERARAYLESMADARVFTH
jgi:hypothetical protein